MWHSRTADSELQCAQFCTARFQAYTLHALLAMKGLMAPGSKKKKKKLIAKSVF